MNSNAVITQFKREFWENKISFVIMPAIVTALIFLLIVCASLYSGEIASRGNVHLSFFHKSETAQPNVMFDDSPQNLGANVSPQENKPKHFDVISSIENDPKAFDNMVMGSMYANCVFLYLVFSIVFASYSLRCLFDDRKNKDILFWRSMPVSETTNVLVKLAMVVVVAPVIMLVLNMLITLLSIFVGFIFFGYFGARISFLLASIAHGQSLFIPFQIFFELLFSLFMLLPVIGFAFFVSALAKKAPFFIFASPALLILADVLLNKFWGLNLGVIDLLQVYVSALVHVKSAFILQESFAIDSSMFLPFIVCIALGALFLAGAIWLRNHRYEI